MDRKIILIGGMPTAGKTTIAKELSSSLNIPWISTDLIRKIMLSVVNLDEKSKIMPWDGYSAEEYLTKFSASQIAQNEYESGIATWPGVEAMFHKNWVWLEGFIVEGVGILPKLAAIEQSRNTYIKSIFISDRNIDRTRETIFSRGLFGNPNDYSDLLKEKEVEWVRLFDEIIRDEAKQFDFPVIDVDKSESDIQKVTEVLERMLS